jgi:hypothetical protein
VVEAVDDVGVGVGVDGPVVAPGVGLVVVEVASATQAVATPWMNGRNPVVTGRDAVRKLGQ